MAAIKGEKYGASCIQVLNNSDVASDFDQIATSKRVAYA